MLVLSANLRKKIEITNIFLKKAQIKTWGSTSLSHINTLSQQLRQDRKKVQILGTLGKISYI
jgi:hypothetical protein